MATFAIGWIVLLLVALWLATQLWGGLQRWLCARHVNRQRIAEYCQEVRDLRAQAAHLEADARHVARPVGAIRQATSPAPVARSAWQGSRKFRVQRKHRECDGCHSFYLVPEDGQPLPAFVPGQFLTFSLTLPNETKPVVRCYSLSAAPRPDYYRCTIKRAVPPAAEPSVPPGKASHYFNSVVQEGDLLDVKAPRGSFQFKITSQRRVVLIAAGVGITPLFSMLQWLSEHPSQRDVRLFYGVRNCEDHILRDELAKIAGAYDRLKVVTFYSRPLPEDQPGRDFDVTGRIDLQQVKTLLEAKDGEYYLCGPGDFMQEIREGLLAWGVPAVDLNFEAFGPSSVKNLAPRRPLPRTNGTTSVRFDRSDKTVAWPPDCSSLLELAERYGVSIDSGCRTGNCGTCETAVKSGRFEYLDEPTTDCDDSACFPCICVPSESIVLDV